MGTLAIILISVLCGLLGGIILAGKLHIYGDTYKGKIRFKQRGKGNVQQTDIRPEIRPLLKRRQEKRLKKKLDKLN